MTQLLTYVADGKLRIAVIDGDELTEVAQVAWPERNGIQEAAIVATNLVEMLHLNGHRPRPKVVAERSEERSDEPVLPRRGRPPAVARFTITRDEVYAILKVRPGLTRFEIAERVWADHGHTTAVPPWVVKNTGNAITHGLAGNFIQSQDEGKRGARGQPVFSYYYEPQSSTADSLPGVG